MPAFYPTMNFLLFQTGWFSCVLSAAALLPWIGAITAFMIIAIHLWHAPQAHLEGFLIIATLLLGTIWDSLLVAFGWLHYPAGMFLPFLAPYWIILLWALFATTLNVSLRWLRPRFVIGSIAGALGGPLAYYAGYRMGAVLVPELTETLVLLGLGWAVLTPLLFMLARKLDGFAPVPAHARVG